MTRDAVFLDTVGLLALWDKSDQWHIAAEEAYQKLTANADDLITTTLSSWNVATRPRDDRIGWSSIGFVTASK